MRRATFCRFRLGERLPQGRRPQEGVGGRRRRQAHPRPHRPQREATPHAEDVLRGQPAPRRPHEGAAGRDDEPVAARDPRLVPEQALQGQEEDDPDEAADAAGEGRCTHFSDIDCVGGLPMRRGRSAAGAWRDASAPNRGARPGRASAGEAPPRVAKHQYCTPRLMCPYEPDVSSQEPNEIVELIVNKFTQEIFGRGFCQLFYMLFVL